MKHILTAVCLVALAGCGGGASTPVICPDSIAAGPAMYYPANGATGVQGPSLSLSFVATSNTANLGAPKLVPVGGGATIVGTPLQAIVIPFFEAPGEPPEPEQVGSNFVGLASHTTYDVEFSAASTGPCSHTLGSGSFTTE